MIAQVKVQRLRTNESGLSHSDTFETERERAPVSDRPRSKSNIRRRMGPSPIIFPTSSSRPATEKFGSSKPKGEWISRTRRSGVAWSNGARTRPKSARSFVVRSSCRRRSGRRAVSLHSPKQRRLSAAGILRANCFWAYRRCEERSDEAIHCSASAMVGLLPPRCARRRNDGKSLFQGGVFPSCRAAST